MNQRFLNTIIIILIIVIILLVLLTGAKIYLTLMEKSESADNQSIVDPTYISVEDFLEQNKSISSANTDFIKKITNYENKIDAWGKNYAEITFIENGADRNIIYFVDGSWIETEDERDTTVLADVYSLNLKTNELKQIYESTPSIYDFHLFGRQNNKLLFEKIDFSDSPGPCFTGWVYAYENPLPRFDKYGDPEENDSRTIKSLDLNNPDVGFSNFSVPEERYKTELLKQNACIEEMEKEGGERFE